MGAQIRGNKDWEMCSSAASTGRATQGCACPVPSCSTACPQTPCFPSLVPLCRNPSAPFGSTSDPARGFDVTVYSQCTRGWKSETLIHQDLCTETLHTGTINYPLKPLSVCILLFQALIEATQ